MELRPKYNSINNSVNNSVFCVIAIFILYSFYIDVFCIYILLTNLNGGQSSLVPFMFHELLSIICALCNITDTLHKCVYMCVCVCVSVCVSVCVYDIYIYIHTHMYILVRCRVTCSKFMSCLRIHCTLQLQQQWSNGQASRREADVNKSGGESGRRGEGGVRGSRSLNGTHTNGNTDSIRIHQCQPIYAHIKNSVCQWQTQRLRRATHTHTRTHTPSHTHAATHDAQRGPHMTSAFGADAQNWGTSQERDNTRRDADRKRMQPRSI